MRAQSAAFIGTMMIGSGIAVALSPAERESVSSSRFVVAPSDEHETNNLDKPRALDETHRRANGCSPDQHAFTFTLYTDRHSIDDNSWEFSHASFGYGRETGNSGTFVDGERMAAGNLGYGAVVKQALCVDKATVDGADTRGGGASSVESCYDVEMRDANGDGLTVPHSAQGGLAGGFSLEIDGVAVAEHRGAACLMSDPKKLNECFLEAGFEYCGVRVCTLNDGSKKATLGGLSGSQCSFAQPQCDPAAGKEGFESASVTVNVETDSFSQELSWEVRKSSRNDSKEIDRATRNELLLTGGMPAGDDLLLGRLGVGVPLADNESFSSVACLPANSVGGDLCFDLRAHDAYGDGMGCGADGALSLIVETPGWNEEGDPRRERVSLTQTDRDMARWKDIDGENRLACTNKERLSKWSYCAVRVCANGDVFGLEGNQCDFGFGEDLIDKRYADVDPLAELEMKPNNAGPDDENDWSLWSAEEDNEEKVFVLQSENLELNIVDVFQPVAEELLEEEDADQSWAEYYETLKPEFRDEMNSYSSSALVSSIGSDIYDAITGTDTNEPPKVADGDTIAAAMLSEIPNMGNGGFDLVALKPSDENDDQDKPNKKGQKRPRPNRPNKQQGQKGPRPDKQSKDDPKPQIQQFNNQLLGQGKKTTCSVDLKRFSVVLGDARDSLGARLKPSQMSASVADYLLAYFDGYAKNNDDVPAPENFELDCTKSKKEIASEVRWVLDCDGKAEFQLPSSVSAPTKKVMANVIRNALRGESKEKLVEIMYDSGEDEPNKKDKKQMKLQKLEAKEKNKKKQQQQMLQQHGSLKNDGGGSRAENQLKKQKKKDKREDKKQMKFDRLETKGQRLQLPQDSELNVMGYESGTQRMNELSDSNNGFDIIDGDIIVYVDETERGGGRGKNRERQRRKRNRNEDDGDRRLLRRDSLE